MKRRKAGANCSKVSSSDNSKIDTPSTATAITTNCLDTKEILMSPKFSNWITGDISETLKTPAKVDFDTSSSIIKDSFSVPLPASTPGSASSTIKNSKHEQQKDKLDQVMLDQYSKEINNLRAERNNSYKHIEKLESRYLSYKGISNNNKKCEYYAGISTDKFNILIDYLEDGLSKTSPSTMSYKDQLLMTLVKLRLNPQFENLADHFNSYKGCTNDIFRRWINLMYVNLKSLIKWPDHDASHKTLPHVFGQYFRRLTAIIDCTEIFIGRPKSLKARAQVYSNYK